MSRLSAEIYELARLSRHLACGNSYTTFVRSFIPEKLPLHTDGIVAPFFGPAMKIERAKLHFEALIDLLERYSSDNKLIVHEVGYEEPEVIWEVGFSIQPYAVIPLMIGDIVHNLRSSLDLLVCDLARLQNQSIEEVKFPFAKDEATLEKILAKDHARLGADVVDAIRALKPFKGDGGNKLLRGLHDLDVIDKHRLIIPTFLISWRRYNLAQRLRDTMLAENPGQEIPGIAFLGDGPLTTTFFRQGDKLRARRGEDPLRYYSEQHERGISAKFPMENSPFAGDEVIPTLHALRKMVIEIVGDFRSQFDRSNKHS